MLKDDFTKPHLKQELKVRIQAVFKNALTQKHFDDKQTE